MVEKQQLSISGAATTTFKENGSWLILILRDSNKNGQTLEILSQYMSPLARNLF